MANNEAVVVLRLKQDTAEGARAMETLRRIQETATQGPSGGSGGMARAGEQQAKQGRELGQRFIGGFKEVAKEGLGAAGLGPVGGLIGLGGIAGMVGAAVTIAAIAARMQYDFLSTTTRAAASMSFGSRDFTASLHGIQAAAQLGTKYGIGPNEMARTMAEFQAASGASPAQTAAAGPRLAMYARATGMDPRELAGLVGQGAAATGGDAKVVLRDAFSAALDAGQFGAMTHEFLRGGISIMQSLRVAQPQMTGPQLSALAFGEQAAMARLGFVAPAANQAAVGAMNALPGAVFGNPALTGLARAAGMPVEDIILGRIGPGGKNIKLLLDQVEKQLGGPAGVRRNPAFAATMAMELAGGDQSKAGVYLQALKTGDVSFGINRGRDADKVAAEQAAKVGATPYGQLSTDFATLQEAMNHLGDHVLTQLVIPALNNVVQHLPEVEGAIDNLFHGLDFLGGKFDALGLKIDPLKAALALSAGATLLQMAKGPLGGLAGAVGNLFGNLAKSAGGELGGLLAEAGGAAGLLPVAGTLAAGAGLDFLIDKWAKSDPKRASEAAINWRKTWITHSASEGGYSIYGGDAGQIARLTTGSGVHYGVPPNLLIAGLRAESNFRLDATSPAGARGIAQFMPATAKQYGVDVTSGASSIEGMAHYLSDLYKRFGNWTEAYMAYNEGPEGLPGFGSIEQQYKTGRMPGETRAYIDRIARSVRELNTVEDTGGGPNDLKSTSQRVKTKNGQVFQVTNKTEVKDVTPGKTMPPRSTRTTRPGSAGGG